MELNTKQNIGTGSAIGLAVLSLILALSGTPDTGDWYYGIDKESNIVCGPLQCDKLSSQNKDGRSTRCYFYSEDLNRTTYKNCKTGWIKFESPKQEVKNITGKEVYLYCLKTAGLIHECQIIDQNRTLYKVSNQ